MTLRRLTPSQSQDLRDEVEDAIAEAVAATMRDFLADVRRATLDGLSTSPATSLTAAADPLPGGEIPSLGAMAGRWASGVDAGTIRAVEAAFKMIWTRYTALGLTLNSPAERAMRSYVGNVRDRLVKGTYFGVPVYDESFEAVRRSLATSTAQGWTRPQLAQRIAAELAWETDGPYWRRVQGDVDYQIDSILDALGAPGSPAREYARLNDPRVLALREQRNLAIKHLDAEKSVWQTRANLIARTESTGVANYGAQAALIAEGAETKVWVATSDKRTRLTHAAAAGQEKPTAQSFEVGGYALMFPGDPNGPVEEVANCRCTIVGADLSEQSSSDLEEFYGDRLHVQGTGEVVDQHLSDLSEHFSQGVHETLKEHFDGTPDGGFYIGDGPVPELDDLGHLRGVRPRGHDVGSTWDTIPGAYDPVRRVVVSGHGDWHGSVSLPLHEGSHALDHALGYVSESDGFREVYYEVHGTLPMDPYFTHPGNPGGYLSEGFAESFTAWSRSRGRSRDDQIDAVSHGLGGYETNPQARAAVGRLVDYLSRLESRMSSR